MADVAFISAIIAFFALATVLVRACDKIIGNEEIEPAEVTDNDGIAA